MCNSIYEIINIGLSLLDTYITYRMMRLLNKSFSYNKRIEFLSYAFCAIANIIIVELVDQAWIIFLSMVVFLLGLSFNYRSKIITKIFSIIFIIFISNLTEIITVFMMGDSLTKISVDETSIHLFVYSKALQFITLSFLIRLENENHWIKKTFLNWYSHIFIILLAIIIEFNILSRELTSKEIMFNILLIIYTLTALIYLYLTEQMQTEKDKRTMQQQIDNYHNQYNILKTSSHIIMELHYNMESHFIAIRKMAEGNEQLGAYIDNFLYTKKSEGELIDTGNLTIDSILSSKFAEAKKFDIQIEHDIIIPANLNIDNFDMTTILAGLLNCGIKAIKYYPDKKLFFSMKFEKSMIFIYMTHDNTVSDEERKKYKYVYADDIAMRSVAKTAEKYAGSMECGVEEGKVYASILLIVPPREKMVV